MSGYIFTFSVTRSVEILANDNSRLPFISRAIYVGGTGDIKAETVTGDVSVFVNYPGSSFLVGEFIKIFETGTTATNLLLLA